MKKVLFYLLISVSFVFGQDYVESYVSTDVWKGSISTTGVSYNGNIYIGQQKTGDYDVIIYFYDDGSYPNYIKWDDGSGHFALGEAGSDGMIFDPGGCRIINPLNSNDKFDLIGGVWQTNSADMYIAPDQGSVGTVFIGIPGENDTTNVIGSLKVGNGVVAAIDTVIINDGELGFRVDGVWYYARKEPAHAYLRAIDSALTIPATQNNWVTVQNTEGDFYEETELDGGFTTSGDTLLTPVGIAGDYKGSAFASWETTNKDNYKMRVTQNGVVIMEGKDTIPATGDGTSMSLPLYFEGTGGDKILIQLMNTTDNDDPIVTHAALWFELYHR